MAATAGLMRFAIPAKQGQTTFRRLKVRKQQRFSGKQALEYKVIPSKGDIEGQNRELSGYLGDFDFAVIHQLAFPRLS